nr:immunoglobulin light chain junction region [Macaca mulatta]
DYYCLVYDSNTYIF